MHHKPQSSNQLAAILLVITIAATINVSTTSLFGQSETNIPAKRLRLPVGSVTPAISLAKSYGIILASNGSLWSWGENDFGWPVLGLDNVKTQLCLRRIGDETNWSSLALGGEGHHHLAIKSDGTIWGWGQNDDGQLGDGTTGRHNKQSIPAPSAPGNTWKQAAVGNGHSLALKRDGTLWAWGDNSAGQIGIASTNMIIAEAVQIGVEGNWMKVWAGSRQSVALKKQGTLWYWGSNPNPAIPDRGPGAMNILSPIPVSPDTNWVDVGFGHETVLALKSDGTLWAWGRAAHEFTGEPDQAMSITPTRVGTNSDWQAICPSGFLCHVLLKKDGSVWSMLAESAGLPKPLRLARVAFATKKSVAAIAGRGNSARPMGVALTRDGEVWTWGKVLGEYIPDPGNPEWGGDRKPLIRENPWQLPNEE